MAKFPTEVEESILVRAPLKTVYAFLWDVPGSAVCIPGIASCEAVGKDTYCFTYQERSAGPVRMSVRYTARYRGNGKDRIDFQGIDAPGDNTAVEGHITLTPVGDGGTKITLKQMLAPDTPVPRLLQRFIESYVTEEARAAVRAYLANVRQALEQHPAHEPGSGSKPKRKRA